MAKDTTKTNEVAQKGEGIKQHKRMAMGMMPKVPSMPKTPAGELRPCCSDWSNRRPNWHAMRCNSLKAETFSSMEKLSAYTLALSWPRPC